MQLNDKQLQAIRQVLKAFNFPEAGKLDLTTGELELSKSMGVFDAEEFVLAVHEKKNRVPEETVLYVSFTDNGNDLHDVLVKLVNYRPHTPTDSTITQLGFGKYYQCEAWFKIEGLKDDICELIERNGFVSDVQKACRDSIDQRADTSAILPEYLALLRVTLAKIIS